MSFGSVFKLLFLVVLFSGLSCRVFHCNADKSTILKGNILWHTFVEENGGKVIHGSIKTNSNTFQIKLVVNNRGNAKLVTMNALGAGELPPVEQRLLPMVLKSKDTTLLFQEWFPALNVREPSTIRVIAAVSTTKLFSVLDGAQPPSVELKGQKLQHIYWEKTSPKNKMSCLTGIIKAPIGTINITWKKEGNGIPELTSLETPNAGELPSFESKLYLWKEASNITRLCQERHPQLNQNYASSYLYPLVKVKTAKLMAGFKRVD